MAKHSVQEILQQHLSEIVTRQHFAPHQHRALQQLAICRTAKLGGHAQYCSAGHLNGIWYNSCKHRACPQCRGFAAAQWRQNTESLLLRCPHHHVIFTLPEELNILWRYNRALMSDILFSAVKATLQLFAADPRYLQATPGILSVLHTWGRNLILHPHLHILISHGGLNSEGEWLEPQKKVLFPQKPVMMVYRGKLLAGVRKALTEDQLKLPPNDNVSGTKSVLNQLARKNWVVHFCPRYDHAAGVAKYLSRYVKSGPFNNGQLSHVDNHSVRFKYKSHRTQRVEVLTLSIDQFIERLMQHVPLPGKASVRYSGLYASSSRVSLNRARALLGQPVKRGREALVWTAYLEQLGYAPLCEVCGLPLIAVSEEEEVARVA